MANRRKSNGSSHNENEKLFELFSKALDAASKKQEELSPIVFNGQRPSAPDYGLSEENPVCSTGLSGSEAYLSRLCTKDGQTFSWNGYSSVRADCNGAKDVGIDKYALYLNGSYYTSVFIAPYMGDSPFPPAGLYFSDSMKDYSVAREAFESGKTIDECFQPDNETINSSSIAPNSSALDTIKKCRKCGKALPQDSIFCQYCGEEYSILANFENKKETIPSAINNAAETVSNEKNDRIRKTRLPSIIAIVLAVILLASNVFQALFWSHKLSEKEATYDLKVASLEDELSSVKIELSTSEAKYKNAVQNLNDAKTAKELLDKVSTFLFSWGKNYQKYSDFNAGSNVIAVKVGQSVELPINASRKGSKTYMLNNSNCDIELMEKSSGKNRFFKITGKTVGTTTITFSVKNSDVAFHVLVIVLPK